MAAILVMAAIGAWAIGTRQISYVVTHGISMNPLYHEGDLVFVIRGEPYRTGEIVAYRGAGSEIEVLHRIVGGDPISGFVFRGDNNAAVDALKPTADRLIGRAVLHVPKGGIWLKPVLSPTTLGMIGFLIVGSGAANVRTRREIPRGRRKKKVNAMTRQGSPRESALRVLLAVQRMSLPLRLTAVAMVAVTAFALVLGVLGWMKPSFERKPPEGAQSMTFDYSATFARTPAYDGTRVTAPDTVFRQVVDRVDLRFHYQGRPGRLEVYAVLSNGSGWRSTMPLRSKTKFSTKVYDSSLTLDLKTIDDRAKAAATAIGVQPSNVSIDLTASVTDTGLAPFIPRLSLTLTPLLLTVPGGPDALVVQDAAARAPTTFVPRTIDVFGHSVLAASSARKMAVLMLLVAVAGMSILLLLARRTAPLHTRAEIERRFPSLLVPVEPMASPPGKPVVNVDNFPALVKLAERYGQMILTWRRPDADDFVVRDEGITYRYRVPLEEPTLQNVEHLNRPNGSGSHRRKASSQVS